ncbi:MAG: hypothetical protein QM811_11690 [Pirellulales bacterium]
MLCAASFDVAPAAETAERKFDPAALEFFEKDVRPLLVKRCYECHGASQGTRRRAAVG